MSQEDGIRRDYANGLTYRDLASKYHKSFTFISNVLGGTGSAIATVDSSSNKLPDSPLLPSEEAADESRHLYSILGNSTRQEAEYLISKKLELGDVMLGYVTAKARQHGFGDDLSGFIKKTVEFREAWYNFALDHFMERIGSLQEE